MESKWFSGPRSKSEVAVCQCGGKSYRKREKHLRPSNYFSCTVLSHQLHVSEGTCRSDLSFWSHEEEELWIISRAARENKSFVRLKVSGILWKIPAAIHLPLPGTFPPDPLDCGTLRLAKYPFLTILGMSYIAA